MEEETVTCDVYVRTGCAKSNVDIRFLLSLPRSNYELGSTDPERSHVRWEAGELLQTKGLEDSCVKGHHWLVVSLDDFDENVGDGHFWRCSEKSARINF